MVYLPKTAAGAGQTLSPEEAREMYERAIKVQEKREDEQYEERQRQKLQKELKRERKKDPMLDAPAPRGYTEDQQRAIEEFLKNQPVPVEQEREPELKLEQAPPEIESELQELMSDPELIEQEPPGGWRCMNEGHQDKPAALKIKHNGMLGAEMGDIYFCEECAKYFKFIPLGDNEEEMKKWIGSSRIHTIKKLAKLAEQCDEKGLHEEADRLDSLIRVYMVK